MKLRRTPHLQLGIVCATALLLGATPPPGQESAGDGECVVLDREMQGDDLRLPKVRAWHTNAEGRLLGTDTIRSLERLSGRP